MVSRRASGPTLLVPIYSDDIPSRVSSSSSSRPKTASSRVSSTSAPPSSWRSNACSPSNSNSSLQPIQEESPRRCRSAPVGFKPCKSPELRLLSSAIGRKSIGTTMTYLTPVLKEQRDYTTDRQARFVKPYSDCAGIRNLDLMNECAKCNLSQATSTATDEKFMRELVQVVKSDINSKSMKAKKFYDESAPSNRKSPTPRNGSRKVEPEACPASEVLWQQADEIIYSVCGIRDGQLKTAWDSIIPATPKLQTPEPEQEREDGEFLKHEDNPRPYRYVKKYMRAYEQEPDRLLKLRTSVLPNMPDFARSNFMTAGKNREVWNWLVSDMRKSAHDYFVSVCG